MSMLAGMMGESAAGSAAGSTAGSVAADGAAASLGSAAASPSTWSTLGQTMGQFGKDYAAGQANPMNTSNLGFNAQTFGQAAKIGDSDGGDMALSYLQKRQRGY